MSTLQKITAAVLLVLLLGVGYGLWATNEAATAPVQKASATVVVAKGSALPVIDQHTLLVAQRLARYATTSEEQPLAQSAVQTADHELDLAFAAALHHLESHPPPLSPQAAQIQQRVEEAQKAAATDTETVKQLTAELAKANAADKPAIQDRLDLAQSQVELEQDEVQEANADLLEAGGNVHQRIQIMQEEHQAAERNASTPAATAPAATALGTLKGMVGQTRQWLALRRKQRWLSWAHEHVVASADELALERQKMAADLAASKARVPEVSAHHERAAPGAAAPAPAATSAAAAKGTAPAAAPAPVVPAPTAQATTTVAAANAAPMTLLDLTRQIAAEQRRLTLRDERIAARRKLGDIYTKWGSVVAEQARVALHGVLVGAAIVLAALLLLLFADRWLERLLGRAKIDRRQLQTLRSVVGVSLQIVGVVVILLVLIGKPEQLGTMLGLAGAGLTVALKDFLVAFIGWFVLMGRNGMRLGDWVEINGVSGEVIELNMFHTVLLETGNWTDAGHPTGRRVTFTNSFAIEGHYFNFSTSGQWLWDELSVIVPYGRDPHSIADAIQKEVTKATADDARQAEEEWKRASRGQRGMGFTAQPGIAVRPATGGVEIAVRYVTRANERLALRARLYQTAVQMLGTPA
jgi:small-conductance mechanosensitive channel